MVVTWALPSFLVCMCVDACSDQFKLYFEIIDITYLPTIYVGFGWSPEYKNNGPQHEALQI